MGLPHRVLLSQQLDGTEAGIRPCLAGSQHVSFEYRDVQLAKQHGMHMHVAGGFENLEMTSA
jgi:hypothetical protein